MERSGTREHYWRLVLRHAVAGNLQAVLDEQVHLLVEANGGFMSCPLSAHYIAGWQPASDFQRSYDGVDRAGIERVRERVQSIDRAGSAVVTASGKRIGYDFLVLSPGIEYMEEAIAGYAQAREQLPVGFRAFEQIAVREQVERFLAKGGNFVISVPAPPSRCPPAHRPAAAAGPAAGTAGWSPSGCRP